MAEIDDFEAQLLAQMRQDFLAESLDILDRLGPLLVELERGSTPDLINSIFREMHTLKGTAGFVGLESITSLAHKLEDVFGALRDEQLIVTPNLVDDAFAGIQLLTAMRENVLNGGTGEADVASLVARLDATLQGPQPDLEIPDGEKAPVELGPEPVPGQDETLAAPLPPIDQPEPPIETPSRSPPPPTFALAPSATSATLRVPVETMDTMMELVGELITARNALLTIAERLRDEPLMDNASVISRLTRELQTAVTSVRLVPVERLFNRFTGVVRNMARERGKRVRMVIEGGDTPLDRTISEQMYDPLIHLLRNAVDHGLEPAAERQRAGKPKEGTIRMSAERRGDNVILRISDDGGGIDPDRVRRVAVERGLYSNEEAAALSDEQAVHLIFASGFSTAEQITDISGRGVGMDVVAQNVRRLRGNVSVETSIGQGTTFVIQLPLALAILQVQLVRVGEYTYALPLHIVRETLHIAPDAIQTMQQSEIIFIRNVALPVRRLQNWLSNDCISETQDRIRPAIVVRLPGRDQVLIVNELVGKQQVVIKPLCPYLGAVPGVEGTAILPDGSVTLILNVEELIG